MRILLFHLPVELPTSQAPRGPLINIMPVGLLALADRLDRDGHEVEVVHAGVERRLDPRYDLVEDVEAWRADLVGLSLHWHPQLFPVKRAVEDLHSRLPGLPIVLGGMTASAFAGPILDRWPGVHAVVTGEGEEPLAALAARFERLDPDRTALPNLVFRGPRGRGTRSEGLYVASQADLDGLDFCRLDLLRHAGSYNGQFAVGSEGWTHPPVFYLGVGRGCSVDCVFCSGGRSGHRRLSGRRQVAFRSIPRVLEDLRTLVSRSIHTCAICFDPPGISEPYYLELFARVKRSSLDVGLVFECYQPPSTELVEAFAAAFPRPGSRLSFSPTVGDEVLRSELLGVRYGNESLERSLALCSRLGVPTTLYFALLPQENRDQIDASLDWQRRLAAEHGCRIIHAPIEMEPGAPWSRAVSGSGLKDVRRGFAAYARRHGPAATFGVRYRDEVGYDFPDVDARVVRVASAMSDPDSLLATALATCGAVGAERTLLVSRERLHEGLALLEESPAVPLVLLVSSEEPIGPWEGLGELAERFGPQVRRVVFDPRRMRHRLWRGREWPSAPEGGRLTVLHVADALAAQQGLELDLDRLPPGLVLAELCRFSQKPCPASHLGFFTLGLDGTLHCCPSSPDLGAAPLQKLLEKLKSGQEETERSRGCARCPVAQICSRCLFTGRLSPEQFCAIRRRMGGRAWPGADRFLKRCVSSGTIDIGWDS